MFEYQIDLKRVWFFSLGLGFLCVLWMWFIVNYVGFFFTILAMSLSIFILSIFFSLMFLPFIWMKAKRGILVYSLIYGLYFVLWNYLFYIFDDLGLSFLQFYFTQSSIYLFYPLFSIHPILVNFVMVLLVFYFVYLAFFKNVKMVYWILGVLVLSNLIAKFYYDFLSGMILGYLNDKLNRENVFLFFISTDTVAQPPDYRIRNENMTFYKLSVALASAYSTKRNNKSIFIFFLPEGSLSKDERYTFNLNNPNLSYSITNLKYNMNNLIGNRDFFSIFGNSFLFFNPTSVDYEIKKIFNSVVLLSFNDINNLRIIDYQIYSKRFLVPFTEVTPGFFKSISKFLSKWIVLYKYLDYSEGKDYFKEFAIRDIKFVPLICFESFKHIYPISIYSNVDFLVVSSNDSWFKNNPMLFLHLKSVRVLSVVKRKPVIFLANGYENRIFIFSDKTRNIRNTIHIISF
ncbi:MAG: hypothetical protein RMJ36_00970 [Candidatus Calescibacterium sp.]|nr:hypothetical protein [Candidatus Calescibacterium sp.]MDW8132212.1 hypothetical protein [Candidatus Calescibacterium sp.]